MKAECAVNPDDSSFTVAATFNISARWVQLLLFGDPEPPADVWRWQWTKSKSKLNKTHNKKELIVQTILALVFFVFLTSQREFPAYRATVLAKFPLIGPEAASVIIQGSIVTFSLLILHSDVWYDDILRKRWSLMRPSLY